MLISRTSENGFSANKRHQANDWKGVSSVIDLLEALMIICFGLSWPVSIWKSYVSGTAKGKSLFFEVFIWIGYVFGILRKVLQMNASGEFGWLFYMGLAFYILI